MSDPSHQAVLEFVRGNPKPFVTTSDTAEEFDSVSKRTLNQRLNDLKDRGELKKYEIGANGVVWYLPVSQVEESRRCKPSSDNQ
jgi:predicted HTH transcriptional regulator